MFTQLDTSSMVVRRENMGQDTFKGTLSSPSPSDSTHARVCLEGQLTLSSAGELLPKLPTTAPRRMTSLMSTENSTSLEQERALLRLATWLESAQNFEMLRRSSQESSSDTTGDSNLSDINLEDVSDEEMSDEFGSLEEQELASPTSLGGSSKRVTLSGMSSHPTNGGMDTTVSRPSSATNYEPTASPSATGFEYSMNTHAMSRTREEEHGC